MVQRSRPPFVVRIVPRQVQRLEIVAVHRRAALSGQAQLERCRDVAAEQERDHRALGLGDRVRVDVRQIDELDLG